MPGTSTSEKAADLRRKANDHPTVASVKAQLPEMPEEGTPSDGLYVEARKTPGIVVNGELRVSVLRLISVGPEGRRLVGQVQATREVDHPLTSWELNLYTHDPEFFQTERVEDDQAWFVDVLEHHYAKADATPELEVGVEA